MAGVQLSCTGVFALQHSCIKTGDGVAGLNHPRLLRDSQIGPVLLFSREQRLLRDAVPSSRGICYSTLRQESVGAWPQSAQGGESTLTISSDANERNAMENELLRNLAGSDGNSKRAKTLHNIVFVSSEVAPYSKTGGLGDVCGSLPIALAERGHRVMVISPRYMNGVTDHIYEGAFDCQCRITVACFGSTHEVAFFHEFRSGVDWVFVDHPSYHRPGTPYGDTRGTFGDNQFRFTLLCHAACEAPLVLPLGGFTYGDKCLFIANDWHAGLVPVLLAAKYRRHGVYIDSRCVLAIHNLAHQGVEAGTTYVNLGLPAEWYKALEWVFPEWARKHALDRGEAVNHLKGAIVTADRILTVSQGYAWEITTPEGGCGLDKLLGSRAAIINGITNGVDIDDWSPATDKHLASSFMVDDLAGKAECKAALQKELGLPVRPDVPLIGFIGRLDYQKGPDVIQAGLPELMTDDVQLVMLGSGDPDMEKWMAWAETQYKEKFRGWVGFSVPVAHRITAGCDILLMPSRFEPCGLNQLYAMRYGTIPVAHATGGLRDTIEDYNPDADGGQGTGTGWTFSPLSKDAMMASLWGAIFAYRNDTDGWSRMMKRGMTKDFSWDRSALQYEQVFEWAMVDPHMLSFIHLQFYYQSGKLGCVKWRLIALIKYRQINIVNHVEYTCAKGGCIMMDCETLKMGTVRKRRTRKDKFYKSDVMVVLVVGLLDAHCCACYLHLRGDVINSASITVLTQERLYQALTCSR